MPEKPHAMIYAPISNATDAVPVYQCCGMQFFQAPQAIFHLWQRHHYTTDAARAQVGMVRWAPGDTHVPSCPDQSTPLGIAAEKQAIIDKGLHRFQASLGQRMA